MGGHSVDRSAASPCGVIPAGGWRRVVVVVGCPPSDSVTMMNVFGGKDVLNTYVFNSPVCEHCWSWSSEGPGPGPGPGP